jgi:Fe-S oxidoreductase
MEYSKRLILNALSTLKENVERTGDPLGFCNDYWSSWASDLNLPHSGNTILFTSRMYQMLPYVLAATRMVSSLKPLLRLKGLDRMLSIGNRFTGEPLLRWKARGYSEIKERAIKSLQGVEKALQQVGCQPAFLYEEEPYSGALLNDLGLEDSMKAHIHKVYKTLLKSGSREIITVDPHTTHMLKDIYPQHIENYALSASHYLERLTRDSNRLNAHSDRLPITELVIHDSCVMTRNLGIVDQTRAIARQLGLKVVEADNNRLDTACCGGPVEYAFGELSEQISKIRISELASFSSNILVTCPICLINFMKYEQELGVRVWDMGEILFSVLDKSIETLENKASDTLHSF